MKLLRSLAVAAGAFSTIAFSATSSHAQMMNCGTPMAMGFIDPMTAPTIDCIVGDKRYYDFVFDGPMSQLSIAENSAAQHTVTLANAGGIKASNFSYKIAITGTDPATPYFNTWQTDTAGAISPNDYKVTVDWSIDGTGPIDLVFSPPGPSSSGVNPFNPNQSMVSSSHTIMNGATVTAITDTVTQTPGPLPILGAGAAFGFSRKLRNRIKASA
jgi:hypothetical protein